MNDAMFEILRREVEEAILRREVEEARQKKVMEVEGNCVGYPVVADRVVSKDRIVMTSPPSSYRDTATMMNNKVKDHDYTIVNGKLVQRKEVADIMRKIEIEEFKKTIPPKNPAIYEFNPELGF
jgi:hypothetical protein